MRITQILSAAIMACLFLFGPGANSAEAAGKSNKANLRKAFAKNSKQSLLRRIPAIAKVIQKSRPSAKIPGNVRAADISGTPPELSDIPATDITTLFWTPGVVDAIAGGSPSPDQCSEFFAGNDDGESGGLGACFMAQSVGYSFEPVLQAGVTLCYLQNAPTKSIVEAGGVGLVSGSFPDDDINKLFNPPSGPDARMVKVSVRGAEQNPEENVEANIFIKVYPAASGNLYQVELWHCAENASEPFSVEQILIKRNGSFTNTSFERTGDTGGFQATISARLLASESGKKVTFDSSRTRTADVASIESEHSFKGEIEITPRNFIKSKTYDLDSRGTARKAYTVSSYSGTNLSDLRFRAGTYKDLFSADGGLENSSNGATEFRNSYYASAPSSDLLSQLDSVDLASDPFFDSTPSVDGNTSGYSCNEAADIEVFIDQSNSAFQAVATACETTNLDGMDFCWRNSQVSQAQANFFPACIGSSPPQSE